jgi:DNA modification methylase
MSPTESLTIEQVPLDLLRPDPANPRRISDAERDALIRSVRLHGMVQPILVRRADRTIIAGHQRFAVARIIGSTTVPVIWLDLPQEEARLLGIRLNKSSGEWDEPLLARLLAELSATPGIDVTRSGYGGDELRDLLRSLDAREKRERAETFDLEAALTKATREPRTKPGDIWRLNEHRLLCGDATNPEHLARLLQGKHAAMTITDPPYGVDLGNHGGRQPGTRRRTIANDALDPVAWEAFLRASMRNVLAATDGAVYVFMSSKEWPTLSRILAEEGAHWSDTLIWQKDRFVIGRADYQRSYEPIWYGWREGAKHFWCGARDQSDVWAIARPSDSPWHPTTKPLALMERAIGNSSRPGDLVLDLFLGSDTTLVACERTGRVCAGLEIDPHYCDVVVARWEHFTGTTAVRTDG